MTAVYTEVTSQVIEIAEGLIEAYHHQLSGCKIGFVFRSEAATAGGKIVLATTSKVTEKFKPYLTEELDMLIVIAEDQWTRLVEEQRKALIDHELCHICLNTDTMGWMTRGHDIEEFQPILERYGLWKFDLFSSRTSMQTALEKDAPAEQYGFLPPEAPKGGLVKVEVKSFMGGNGDELQGEAVAYARGKGHVTISGLQRYLRIGYGRASRLVEEMQDMGVIGRESLPDGFEVLGVSAE